MMMAGLVLMAIWVLGGVEHLVAGTGGCDDSIVLLSSSHN